MNFRLLPALFLSLSWCVISGAQPATGPDAAILPPVAVIKSPVEMFREMLAAPPARLDQILAGRPPAIRARLQDKLKEYRALPPDERELRLQLTQLRWNLLRLLPLSPEQRTGQLSAMSAPDRKLVVDRLEEWDRLEPAVREEVLQYEQTLEQIVTATNRPVSLAQSATGTPPLPTPPELPRDMGNFLRLPMPQRHQVYESFERFFELSVEERQRTLAALSPPVPPEASNALRNLENLTTPQRSQYLAAMRKFSGMSEAERREFLVNAARWKELTPAERQAWRTLVNHLQPAPPMPQEIASSLMPPPLPMTIRTAFHAGTNSVP